MSLAEERRAQRTKEVLSEIIRLVGDDSELGVRAFTFWCLDSELTAEAAIVKARAEPNADFSKYVYKRT